MRSILYCYICIILVGCQANQHKPSSVNHSHRQELVFPYQDSSFNWKRYEKQNDELKQSFINHLPADLNDSYDQYLFDHSRAEGISNMKAALHVMDINHDGHDDIFYEGHSGGEATQSAVYLNLAQGFKKVFSTNQFVKKLVFNNGKLSYVFINNPGCCAEYIVYDKIFEFTYPAGGLVANQKSYTAYHQITFFPQEFLTRPVHFITRTDSSYLRVKPALPHNDTLFMSGDVHVGNDVCRLGKGSAGRAIGKRSDREGNLWWLVEMSPKAVTSGNVLYYDSNSSRYGVVGWLNDRDIRIDN